MNGAAGAKRLPVTGPKSVQRTIQHDDETSPFQDTSLSPASGCCFLSKAPSTVSGYIPIFDLTDFLEITKCDSAEKFPWRFSRSTGRLKNPRLNEISASLPKSAKKNTNFVLSRMGDFFGALKCTVTLTCPECCFLRARILSLTYSLTCTEPNRG